MTLFFKSITIRGTARQKSRCSPPHQLGLFYFLYTIEHKNKGADSVYNDVTDGRNQKTHCCKGKSGMKSILSKSTWCAQPVEGITNFTCINVCICVSLFIYLCQASWANEKQYRPEIWHTYSHWPYLKTRFSFFRQNDRDGRYPEKLPFHVDFSLYLLDCLVCKMDFDTIGSFWSTNIKNFWI